MAWTCHGPIAVWYGGPFALTAKDLVGSATRTEPALRAEAWHVRVWQFWFLVQGAERAEVDEVRHGSPSNRRAPKSVVLP